MYSSLFCLLEYDSYKKTQKSVVLDVAKTTCSNDDICQHFKFNIYFPQGGEEYETNCATEIDFKTGKQMF